MVDLHTHSVYSDGTDTPEELMAQAQQLGLTAVALCDHNCMDGIPKFLAAAQSSSVAAVPGIELSTQYAGRELHILGLFLHENSYDGIMSMTQAFLERKAESNRLLVQRLAQAGYAISYEQLQARCQGSYINRPHIAALLMEKGYIDSIQTGFRTLLSEKHGYYVPPELPSALSVIESLRSLHVVPVLAHPFLALRGDALRVFLRQAVDAGLAAMETRYSLFSQEETEEAIALAQEFGLAESGGSDHHGGNKPHIQLGTGQGTLSVPDSIYYELAALKNKM